MPFRPSSPSFLLIRSACASKQSDLPSRSVCVSRERSQNCFFLCLVQLSFLHFSLLSCHLIPELQSKQLPRKAPLTQVNIPSLRKRNETLLRLHDDPPERGERRKGSQIDCLNREAIVPKSRSTSRASEKSGVKQDKDLGGAETLISRSILPLFQVILMWHAITVTPSCSMASFVT